MPLALPYVGEAITKLLIERLHLKVLTMAGLDLEPGEQFVAVHHGVALCPLNGTGFDGAATIDLILETSIRYIGIEVKLGITRLNRNRFEMEGPLSRKIYP